MSDLHQQVISPKMPAIRQRLPFSEAPSTSMIKLERGLVQHSVLYCLEKGYFSLIRYLLESSTGNARERDNEGRTGLIYCCFVENDCWAQNIAMTLLEYGAKIEDQDQRGLNALHYATIRQRLILVRRYLASLDFNLNQSTDIHGNTCLHYACSTGNADIVRYILNTMKRYSIDLTMKNHYGLTPYDIACQLNHDRCQNLVRDEITLREHSHQLSSVSTITATKVSHVTIVTLAERRVSSPTRMRRFTNTSCYAGSVTSVPIFISGSKSAHKRRQSTFSFDNEKVVYPPSIFIDRIASRNMTLKRNEVLDTSLVNQIKTRADFTSSTLASQSSVFNASSTTWREDVSKVFDLLQTFKTPSYKRAAHPPLNNELSCELFEHVYDMGGADGHDCSNHQPLSSLPICSLPKATNRRRSSIASLKSLNKTKK